MIYLELFLAFLEVGLFSFGGAYAAIPLIRDVVLEHAWMSDEQIAYIIAVSESTPGPIMVNMATYVGSTQGGIFGAFLATFGVVLPAFVIILLIMILLKNFLGNKYVQAVLQGLKACVVGIILATGLHMIVTNCIEIEGKLEINWQTVIIMMILLLVMFLHKRVTKKKLSPIKLIMVSAVVGIVVCGIV
jgi:chromate transporter